MELKTKAIVGAVAVSLIAGLVVATPIIKLASPVLALGSIDTYLEANGYIQTTGGKGFTAHLQTDGPTTVETQLAAYSVGGENGWHSHPGLVTVTLTAGKIEWFNDKCEPTIYSAGDAWVEGSQVHFFRNIGPVNVQLSATYIIAKGEPARIDQPAPACAAALNLT